MRTLATRCARPASLQRCWHAGLSHHARRRRHARRQGRRSQRRHRRRPSSTGTARPVCRCSRWLGRVFRPVGGDQSLRSRAVPLALGLFLVRVRHADGPIAQELSVHPRERCVGRLEGVVGDEAEASGPACLGVAHDLGEEQHSEGGEGVVQHLLVDLGLEVADEQVCAHLVGLLVLRRLVAADRLAEEPDHVHDLDGVVRVVLVLELDEAVALVRVGDLVARQVDVGDGRALDHQLPQNLLIYLRV
mmetsp:Transcript_54190/g.108830  ORF Transcript_54190/g.108830 Transcript_54190/m.108830 type:complete len:247 (+) Transcript_54190:132-872(+)